MPFDLEGFLARAHRAPAQVEVNGVPMFMRAMSADERVAIHDRLSAERGERKPTGADHLNFQCALIAACAVDEAGQRIFTTEALERLRKQDGGARVFEALGQAAMRANDMLPESAAPNAGSETSQSGDSPSA